MRQVCDCNPNKPTTLNSNKQIYSYEKYVGLLLSE